MPLYFAYGSNMSTPRLERRIGCVRVLGRARLDGYRHRFSKHGNDGTAKGNVEPSSGTAVWGVLYALDDDQLARLELFESGYRRVRFEVELDRGERLDAHSFEALAAVRGLVPTDAYLAHYRAGMREHQLPADYQRELLRSEGLQVDEPTDEPAAIDG